MNFKQFFSKLSSASPKADTVILYGTKSGNSKDIAREVEKQLNARAIRTQLANMARFKPEDLKDVKKALIVVSTHDEGEPPVSARKFYRQLFDSNMAELKGLKYAICGLGDSSYDQFCEAGKSLDRRLAELGAQAVIPRIDCDTDFSEQAVQWIRQVIKQTQPSGSEAAAEQITLERTPQYTGTLAYSKTLFVNGEGNATTHLELKDIRPAISFKAGDLLELMPVNPDWLVQKLCRKLNSPDSFQVLKNEREISRVSANTLKAYAKLCRTDMLDDILSSDALLKSYLKQANALDILLDFPSDLTAEDFIAILPPLTGRQYSISNQMNEAGQLDLLIKTVRFQFNERLHEGAASVYTNESFKVGDNIRFRLVSSPEFQLKAADKSPLLLIASGTGIAPFRGFLQELSEQQADFPIWLIWGEQQHYSDHLYNEEFESLQKAMPSLQIDFVESRGSSAIRYAQDQLLAKQQELRSFLQQDARIYVCGSKSMGKDVEALIELNWQATHPGQDWEAYKTSEKYRQSVY